MGAAVVRPMRDGDHGAVVALWHRAGVSRPWNDPARDIALAMRGPHSTILVAELERTVAGTVMAGEDGHRGWVYYLATDPARRNQGLGRMLMEAAEAWLADRGMQKAQLLVREENRAVGEFYARIGYRDVAVACLQKIIGA